MWFLSKTPIGTMYTLVLWPIVLNIWFFLFVVCIISLLLPSIAYEHLQTDLTR